MGRLTHKQLFLAVRFPRGDRGTVQVDRDGLAGGQAGLDNAILNGNGRLWERGTHADRRGLVGAVHCEVGEVIVFGEDLTDESDAGAS